jgi:hypothetical protein
MKELKKRKWSHYDIEVLESKGKPYQRSCLYLLLRFHKLYFLLFRWMKNKTIIQHPIAEPQKALW